MPTPLYDALRAYAGKSPLRFHMPGHKGKFLPAPELAGLAAIDVTELAPTGNLYETGEPFDSAQALWAELFGFEDATGVITSKGEAALFSLPLDESKANAQKAEELAGIWDQPQPAAPQTSGEALPADGEFIIWSDGETESVIVIE